MQYVVMRLRVLEELGKWLQSSRLRCRVKDLAAFDSICNSEGNRKTYIIYLGELGPHSTGACRLPSCVFHLLESEVRRLACLAS